MSLAKMDRSNLISLETLTKQICSEQTKKNRIIAIRVSENKLQENIHNTQIVVPVHTIHPMKKKEINNSKFTILMKKFKPF